MSAVSSPESSEALDDRKEALQSLLRASFGSLDRRQLRSHPLLEPYTRYYRRFEKSYHVQGQLESVVFKRKAIPRGSALVEALFMAELKNLLLTAGHDLDAIQGDMGASVAAGTETYVSLSGQERTLQPGDMFIHDEVGVLSSIIYGPDRRTPITRSTQRVLFTAYAPDGVPEERVRLHLHDLQELVLVVSPGGRVDYAEVLAAAP